MTFEVIPAIDLRGGRCVRLYQGDYAQETGYADDPISVAKRWEGLGAPRLHVVDLDGAKAGHPVQRRLLGEICMAVGGLQVEVSGGIRDLEAIEEAMAYGAHQVQLGSIAVRDPGLVRRAVEQYGSDISVSIDARDGEVRTDGWTATSGMDAFDFARRMADLGVLTLMFTDIGRDSTLTEPNFAALETMVKAVPCNVVASGGVATVEHLVRLGEIGCRGAIVGKALYEGTIDLAEALEATERFWPPDED